MKNLRFFFVAASVLLIGMAAYPSFAQTSAPKTAAKTNQATRPSDQELNIRAYVELLRSDVRARATSVVQEVMQLSDSEGAKFWPIYREYEAELGKQGDRRFQLIKEYSDHYGSMSDEAADKIVRGSFELEQARLELKKRYYERIKAALGAVLAARFLQVNNQILWLIDLQIASALPVVQ